MGDGGAGASAALLRRGERTGSVGNERTGARASSTVREWWAPHTVNGSLTEGATSCLTVGPRCHKPCQSAFSGRSVLFETNWPKCGSSVRLERKLVVFRNFASKVLVLCYILIDLLCPLKLCSNYSLAVLVMYVLEKLKYFLIPLSLFYNTFYVISMCVEGIILCSRIMEELVVYDWCDNLPRSTG
jgi:hypothetical protein